MSVMEQENKPLNACDLLNKGQKYFIPNYQRNYAWEIDEVRQLLQDVADMKKREGEEYFVGNLIVRLDPEDLNAGYETIDGQQRLTTLYIIICALIHNGYQEMFNWFNPNCLSFRNRDNSTRSLEAIYKGDFESSKDRENHIIDVCRNVFPVLKSICERDCNGDIDGFIQYFIKAVKFLRIEIPNGVDRNHYFEVMNSRGIQLTPSEIVKAEMMQALVDEPEEYRNAFSLIWNACSNMEHYVVMNIPSGIRSYLFGHNWNTNPLEPHLIENGLESRFENIALYIKSSKIVYTEHDRKPESLRALLLKIEKGTNSIETHNSSAVEIEDYQYYSVISFPNFLIHVLRLMRPKERDSIILDDKELSREFHAQIKKSGACFVKQFTMILLQSRFLFDKYIVRRDSHEHWVLNKVVENQNKPEYIKTFSEDKDNEILLLLEMFHVSNTSQNHKNWLSAVLSFVYQYPEVSSSQYLEYLRSLALSFMRKRYLTRNPLSFDSFIFNEDGNVVEKPSEGEYQIDETLLDNGVSVENFVFNYYDYLLWSEPKESQSQDVDYKQFEFSYRNSVEHFYPQNPRRDELLPLQERFPSNREGEKALNCFGNLFLITPSQNSRFTNDPPKAKYERFKNNKETNAQSLKLQLIFKTLESHDWDKKEIEDANVEAHKLILRRIS